MDSIPDTLPEYLTGRVLMAAPRLDEVGDYADPDGRFTVTEASEAHIVTSLVPGPERTFDKDGLAETFLPPAYPTHRPVLDIDVPHHSSSAGFITFEVDPGESTRRWTVEQEVLGHLTQTIGIGHAHGIDGFISRKYRVTWWLPEGFTLVPSSTEGHSHLYIPTVLGEVAYRQLLVALARVGVLEPGFVRAALYRGHSAARLPWVHKGDLVLSSEVRPKPEPIRLDQLEEWIGRGSVLDDPCPFIDRTIPHHTTTERTTS